jgi:CRP-like cAMP-binding protein
MLSKKHQGILSHTTWFDELNQDAQDFVLRLIKVVPLRKGQCLYMRGAKGDGFHSVLDGRIRVSNINANGKEMVLAYLDQGSSFGEISMFDGLGRTHNAHAETTTELAFLSHADFQSLVQKFPQVYEYFTRLLCTRLRTAFNFIDASANLTLRQQLIKRLILHSSNYGHMFSMTQTTEIKVSQESLAMMINSSRQTVNQLLKELEKQGLIRVNYGRIALLDTQALKALCEWE